jgi:hypothetical protein
MRFPFAEAGEMYYDLFGMLYKIHYLNRQFCSKNCFFLNILHTKVLNPS